MMFVLYDGWLHMNRTEMINDFKNFLRENQESIHRHNAYAEKVTTLGELKEELNI